MVLYLPIISILKEGLKAMGGHKILPIYKVIFSMPLMNVRNASGIVTDPSSF